LSESLNRVAGRLSPDAAPDGELLALFLDNRDEAAFAALVRRHAAMVFGTCRRVLGNAADAEDAFQAAFVVLVRRARSLTDRACVGNFLYGVAFHTALKAKAMAAKRRAREARAVPPAPPAPDQTEELAALDEELARLPERYREPVVLCELEGVSRKDAAGRLGIPEGTISSRLATAHRMLAKRLKARGLAATSVLAVLSSRGGAVSEALANAAVRAVVAAPPATVARLASEVTKMFLLHRLRVGVLVVSAVALVAGVAVALAPEKPALGPQAKAAPEKVPVPQPQKAAEEPAWKKEFREKYGLKDGEHVRRIAPPYPACREEYLNERFGRPAGRTNYEDYFTVLGWRGDWAPPELGRHTLPVKPNDGIELARLLDLTASIARTRLEGPDELLAKRVTGDFVVRADATADQIVSQLQTILKKECDLPVSFNFKDDEETVFVLSGKYEAHPLDGRDKNHIEVYGGYLADPARNSGGGSGGDSFDKFLGAVEQHVGRRVVMDKIEGLPKRVSWHYNVRSPMLKDPNRGIDTYAEDTNPDAVLENVARQTGLVVKTEKRKVRVLVVEKADR
jgi:RNA polymerase sigma factor (sigma-70 family)